MNGFHCCQVNGERGKIKRIHIIDSFHMPKLQADLISMSKLLSNGLNVDFNLIESIMRSQDGKVISMGLLNGNLYEMDFKKVQNRDAVNLVHHGRKMVHVNFGIIGLGIWM